MHLRIGRTDRDKIVRALKYDKRKDGARGRCLRWAIPELGLRAEDRLEPCPTLLDVAMLDDVAVFPLDVVFWRRGCETRVRHRNPLMDNALGINVGTLVVDMLHALHLGCMKDFCKHAVWELVLCNAWRVATNLTEEEHLVISCQLLKAELVGWYKERHAARPLEHLTQIQDLKPSMLGTKNQRCLKLKAAETKGFLVFMCWLLRRRGDALHRGDLWLAAADGLERILELTSSSPLALQYDVYQDNPMLYTRPTPETRHLFNRTTSGDLECVSNHIGVMHSTGNNTMLNSWRGKWTNAETTKQTF